MGSIPEHFELRDFELTGAYEEGIRVVWEVRRDEPERPPCPHCGSRSTWCHGWRSRRVAHLPIGSRPGDLKVKFRRYRCVTCKRTFTPKLPGVRRRARLSDALKEFVGWALTYLRVAVSRLGGWLKLGWNTVWGCVPPMEQPGSEGLRYLCLDEVFYRGPRQYLTVLSDGERGKALGVTPGRGYEPSRKLLLALPETVRQRIETLATDFNYGQRKAAAECLPCAEIAADRFHLVRLARRTVRDSNPALLPASRRAARQLRALLNAKDPSALRSWLAHWHNASGPLRTLVTTVARWELEIESYLITRRTTGPAEALNRKIALLRRQACGYTNLDNFIRRILLLNSPAHH